MFFYPLDEGKIKLNVIFRVDMHSATACLKSTHIFNAQKQLGGNEIAAFVCRVDVYCCGCGANYFRVLAPLQPEKKVANIFRKIICFAHVIINELMWCWVPLVCLEMGAGQSLLQ